jgi:hypothetical protein
MLIFLGCCWIWLHPHTPLTYAIQREERLRRKVAWRLEVGRSKINATKPNQTGYIYKKQQGFTWSNKKPSTGTCVPDLDVDADPDPAIFVNDLQEANKKLI